MKKQDIIAVVGALTVVALLVIPVTSQAFFGFTDRYALLGGFIKFFVFASIGDVLSHRIRFRHYRVTGLVYKALVWGFIGVVLVFVFNIYASGVEALQLSGLLPMANQTLAFAFFVSLFMNLTFAPTMMLFHRLSDHYIEHRVTDRTHTIKQTIRDVDYHGFVRFVVLKTLPFFWIPAHTITFSLPETYRVFFASLLGVALGLLLGIAKTMPRKEDV